METHITDILAYKGPTVFRTRPDASVREAVNEMNERHIGALLVMENDKPVGMFTERDVLKRVVAVGRNPETTRIVEVMSQDLLVVPPEMTIEDAIVTITQRRHRHLPVLDKEGRLLGMISIGDLMRWIVRDRESYIKTLSEYIWGPNADSGVVPGGFI